METKLIKELTPNELQEKIKNGENFILDCHGLWCGPCKAMMPHFEAASQIIKEINPTIGVYKYDIDSDRNYTISLGIRSVPTIKVYKKGEEIFSQPGMKNTEQLVNIYKTNFE